MTFPPPPPSPPPSPPPPLPPADDPSTAWSPPPPPPPPAGGWLPRTQLRRSRTDKVLGGVAGGLAEYTGVDALLWRVGAIALTLAGGSGVVVYALLWLLMPAAPAGQGATLPAGATEGSPPAPRGPRSPVPRVVLAALLIVVGISAMLSQFTDLDLGPRGFLGTALLVVGVGLVVSALTGQQRPRRGGLINVGILLSVATLFASTVDLDDLDEGRHGSMGDRTYRPATAAAVLDRYDGGVGDLEIDLTRIDPGTIDRPVALAIDHGVGDVTVLVPRDADVFVAGEGGIGDIEFEGETIEEDGVTYPGTGPGDWVGDDRAEFRISISNGIGDVEVSRA